MVPAVEKNDKNLELVLIRYFYARASEILFFLSVMQCLDRDLRLRCQAGR